MDRLVIHRVGDHGREGLCDPEGVPDTGGAHAAAQHPRNGHDEDDIAAEGDDQRGHALPRPSSAPEEVVDTAETMNPRQMIRRAVWPMAMVSGLEVNRPISGPAMVRQSRVPMAMIPALRPSVRL